MPTEMIYREVPFKLFDALEATADTKGTSYALPRTSAGARTLTWQTKYAVAPGAVNITLEGAIEDVDALYGILDTSTVTGGEIRTVTTASAIKYVRSHQNSRTGDTAHATVTINVS